MTGPLVSTEWLAERLGAPGVKVVDASWYLPAANRDALAEYRAGHIPGAVFFDIDAISDRASPLPHMLPSAGDFAAAMGALGLSDTDTIVVYDGAGLFSAPRVRWTLRVFGARDVFVLDGGLPQWRAEGRPLESGDAAPEAATFHAALDAEAVAGIGTVAAALGADGVQVVDARPGDRFRGEAPEPRPGLRSGHMPGARNVPASAVIADGRLKDGAALAALFADAGVDPTRPVIASCGSGVTAAVVALALETIGAPQPKIYDGSWAEWGGRPETAVVTGPAD
ncbi:3-mercaptopyruvate sulfurtransferase [Prosthecomicrobium pneumaticum]|uniref:3-mercaptopyruvate sulfurtransferase n=1 Tax=Prosthecomicrobium pneumaticum TaxID=81895 RepID=A0A7W9FQD8_9HYPH|nr:3-mercaptopyruvate sulfurtransferase [Prosthecomicrobium pneumaticum]MBB5754878.1 thiosulfate/3-mercaptopyruvate sulfurtransferase [Prosthecomicrobium pneumaticum]